MTPTYHSSTDKRCEISEVEKEIIKKLEDLGIPIVPQVKLGNNWVFDGAINGTKILVEVHGDYWHELTEVVARDQRKQEWADLNGYTILTIWERDYQADPDGALKTVQSHYNAIRAFVEPAQGDKQGDKHDTPPAIAGRVYGDWRDRFLAVLSERGIVREACIAAGVSRNTAYAKRQLDADFAADWKLALQDAADLALVEYRKRGMQQSDRAMEFFIKSRDPETYGEPGQVELVLKYLDMTKLSNEQLDRLAAGEDPLSVLFSG